MESGWQPLGSARHTQMKRILKVDLNPCFVNKKTHRYTKHIKIIVSMYIYIYIYICMYIICIYVYMYNCIYATPQRSTIISLLLISLVKSMMFVC